MSDDAVKKSQDPIPHASVYLQAEAFAQQAYDMAMAMVNAKKAMLAKQYGLMGNGQIDPRNPFGAIQAMKYRQALGLESVYDDDTARGIGFSGLGGQPVDTFRYQYGAESAQLGNAYENALFDLNQAAANAEFQKSVAMWQAEQEAAAAAIANGDYPTPPAAPGNNDPGTQPPPSQPPPPPPPPTDTTLSDYAKKHPVPPGFGGLGDFVNKYPNFKYGKGL